MTNAQKTYLKNWLYGLGALVILALLITSLIVGGTWLWIALVVAAALLASAIALLLYTLFAKITWHWRLMGECKTPFEEELLEWWWFWIWRSDCWKSHIYELIAEAYEVDSKERKEALEFCYRLGTVNKPRWL